jgi:hypothetical protein
MRDLTELGFERYPDTDASAAALFQSRTGFTLPASYLEFLCFREPSAMPLAFRFTRDDGEEWVGCVSEFHHIAPHANSWEGLAARVIRPAGLPGRAFLPIGCDPGGNWLCLELSRDGVPVVDVDHRTGMISQVAASFEDFLELLHLPEDRVA